MCEGRKDNNGNFQEIRVVIKEDGELKYLGDVLNNSGG